MADTIQFQISDGAGAKVASLLARIQNPEPALRDFGAYKQRQIVRSMPRMPRAQRSTPGQPPARRSGLLAQRITYEVTGSTLNVGTYDVRAAILHFGGTIRPRVKKFLAIPVHADAQGKRPKDFGNLELIPRKGKPSLLVRWRTKEERVDKMHSEAKERIDSKGKAYYTRTAKTGMDVMFVLLKKVTLPPRPFLLWRNPQDENYLVKALQRQIKGASA